MSEKSLVERELQGQFLTIFKDIFKNEKYRDFDIIQEKDRADLTITHGLKSLFFLELKDPLAKDGKSVENAEIFKRESLRAKRTKIPHFGITNFTEAIIHSIDLDTDFGEEDRKNYEFRNFATIGDIERYRNSKSFSKDLNRKFTNLANWYLEKAEIILKKGVIEKQAPDEIFILKLQKSIGDFGFKLSEELFERYENNREFKLEIQRYFQSQQWSIPTEESDFDNFAHIAILIFVSKIIFYKAVRDFGHYQLDEFKVFGDENLEEDVWRFFRHLQIRTGDFELLIGDQKNIENKIIFQNRKIAKSIIDEVLESSETYNFSKMKEDIIGRIFEELIKPDERHKLGQYFTSSEVVKTINSFCVRDANSKVLDPSCGSGAFLTGLYERKKSLGEKDHSKLLEEIHGVDISSYPAFLSILNLAIRDLSQKSYPRIIKKDFFSVANQLDNQNISLEKIHDSDGKEFEIEFLNFDAIVGNPPYTRQEDIDSYNPDQKFIINQTLASELGKFSEHISKRTSIYAYFFYRAKRLLKDGGYLGFITSNSWLDVDFGENLQKFMVDNFQVVAIIDSKVERFFESADVNTNITILRKGRADENFKTKFVYLKEKLSKVLAHFGNVDNFRDFVEKQNEIFENEFLRINPVLKTDLENENKWSKFLKAPKIYWEILKKGEGKWRKLSEVANVRFGIKTGVNEFFYLEDISNEETPKGLKLLKNGIGEEVFIEEQFLKPVIKSPREIKGYVVKPKDLKFSVLMVGGFEREEISAKFPFLEKYLKRGEERGYPERSSLLSRRNWWELPNFHAVKILTQHASNEIHKFYFNESEILEDARLYGINGDKNLFNLLNFSFVQLQIQLTGRSNLGEGALDLAVYEIGNLLINIISNEVKNYLENFDIDKFNQKNLDIEILKSIGFREDEISRVLEELYEAVADLVNSRLAKAKSVKKTSQKRKSIPTENYLAEFQKLIKKRSEKSSIFFQYLFDEVVKISPDKRVQKNIVSLFWKNIFSENLPTLKSLQKLEKENKQKELF
jgi:methylase of polypeptide subunit release factors